VLRDASAWVALSDYPAVWWSQALFISETLAARTGCYDVFSRRWLASHLDAASAPTLPQVVRAGTVVGTVTPGALLESGAVSRSTLVVAGGHDHPVAASVVRRIDPTAVVDSLGTANLVYGETDAIEPHADPYIAFSVPVLGQPGVACLGVFEFSASLEAARSRDSGTSLHAFLGAEEALGEPGDEQQLLLALRQILGVETNRHQLPHQTDPRTLLEAACFYARRMLESVRAARSGGERVYSVGGWARSKALLQLRASVLGEPLFTIDERELTALGAALIARDAAMPPGTRDTWRRDAHIVLPNAEWQSRYALMYTGVREVLKGLR
jgi:xylulokinase